MNCNSREGKCLQVKRAEKIILASGAGVLCVGVLLSLVAFVMGGRPASMVIDNDGLRVERWDAHVHAPESLSQQGTGNSISAPAQTDGWSEYELPAAGLFDVEAGMCELVVKPGEPGSAPVLRVQNMQKNWMRWKTDTGWLEIDLCTDLHGLRVPDNVKAELILPPDTTKELKIASEMADVQICGLSLETLRADAQMGNIEITDTTAQNASFDAEMGNVSFTGCLAGRIEANTEMGNVELKISRPQRYSWQIESEMGSVTIDGQKFEAGTRQKNGEGLPFFDLETEMGDVTVDFT